MPRKNRLAELTCNFTLCQPCKFNQIATVAFLAQTKAHPITFFTEKSFKSGQTINTTDFSQPIRG